MKKRKITGIIIAGIGAGAVNGLFGAGGGMVLVPLLSLLTPLEEDQIFGASIAVILPICIVSLTVTAMTGSIAWRQYSPISSAAPQEDWPQESGVKKSRPNGCTRVWVF